jgi:hypothetical protein
MLKGVEHIKNGLVLLLILIAYVLGVQGCDDFEPSGNNNFIISYDLLKTKIVVRFTDAKTGELLSRKGVNVKVNGEAKNGVVDISGLMHNTYKSANGFLILALIPVEEYSPSETNPVRFSLEASLSGYLTASKTIVLTRDGTYHYQIAMAKVDDLPEGISEVYKTGVGTIVNDTLTGKVSVSTPGLEARLILPPKTVLLDAQGMPLAGPLKISLKYFGNTSDAPLSLFPGGLMSPENREGVVSDGMFFTAGYVSLNITGNNGKKAASFSNEKPRLELLVDKNTFNPQTGAKIETGDFIQVYDYDFETGVWNYENNDTILNYTGIPPVGDFVVTAQISSATYLAFSWFEPADCYNGAKIVFGSDSSYSCFNGFVSGILRRQTDSSYVCWLGGETGSGDTLSINSVPSSQPLFIDWLTDSCNNISVSPGSNPLYIDNLCSNEVNVVPVTLTGPGFNGVTVEMNAHCPSNPDIDIKPSSGIWYYAQDTPFCWHWSNMNNGVSKLCGLELGQNYVVGTCMDGHWYQWNFTLDESFYFKIDFDFSSNICMGVFGM